MEWQQSQDILQAYQSSLMSSFRLFKEKATLNVLPLSNCKQDEVHLVLEKTRTRVVEGTTLQSCTHSIRAEIQAQVNIGMLCSYIHAWCLKISIPSPIPYAILLSLVFAEMMSLSKLLVGLKSVFASYDISKTHQRNESCWTLRVWLSAVSSRGRGGAMTYIMRGKVLRVMQ